MASIEKKEKNCMLESSLLHAAIDSLIDAEVVISAIEPSQNRLITHAHDLITRALAALNNAYDELSAGHSSNTECRPRPLDSDQFIAPTN